MTPIHNQSTTHIHLTGELERLRVAARRLWDIESGRQVHRQIDVLNELVDLDLELERLSLRVAVSRLGVEHRDRLNRCAERLRELGGSASGPTLEAA